MRSSTPTRSKPSMDEGDGDDEAAQEMLSDLFLSSDRLMHDPTDEDGTNGLLKAVEVASEASVPYGLAPATGRPSSSTRASCASG